MSDKRIREWPAGALFVKTAVGLLALLMAVAPASAASAESVDTGPLIQERVIPAPVADVWTAFTTKKGLEAWMVPHAEIDLTVGGRMLTNYNPDGRIGDPQTIENTILSFHPRRMLSIKATKPPAGFKWAEAIKDMWSVIYFEPVGPNRARITCCGFGYNESEASQQMRRHFVAGNEWTFDRLEEHFAGKAKGDRADSKGEHTQSEPDGDALTLLAKTVGGEWIHESKADDGSVFRVRNVVTYAPDGKSLVANSWLGDADGMLAHGTTQIWREPGTNEVRFQNLNEVGAIGRGRIDRVNERTLTWDWNAYQPDGSLRRFSIDMIFPDDDHYRMVMRHLRPDGTAAELLSAVYQRVEKAPERFRQTAQKRARHDE